ncbi:FtsX-like permease family protein [Jatrophihabitans telluris]|uniref:FtsX-like permease family protein n=1 Tax=Jatrophihabitans telluris TaxID=2038343 RepID=A0ABY4R1T9_9ACTN|nr:FtsX-like permease family protein [Jatrophihabitans telluris]UQX89898.1 FtsX-like permease family protein [Jatrophihabitans telluris]
MSAIAPPAPGGSHSPAPAPARPPRRPGVAARRALLRMGWRTVRRNRLRSVLIIVLITFPVTVVAAADVFARSNPLSPLQAVASRMGDADAKVTFTGAHVEQDVLGDSYSGRLNEGETLRTIGSAGEIRSLLPTASVTQVNSTDVLVNTAAGALHVSIVEQDLGDAAIRPALTRTSGRWATATGQAVISDKLARDAHLDIGATMSLRGTVAGGGANQLTVVGIVHDVYQGAEDQAWVTSATTARLGLALDQSTARWLVTSAGGVSWADVLRLNEAGYLVSSRAVILNPPPKSAVAYFQHQRTSASARLALTIFVAVGLVILQLALLAGPAFAVSARRRQRDMALLAAVGGTRRQLARSMLSEGLVLGVLASLLGILLGIGTAVVLRAEHAGVLGPLRLRPLELAAIALLGVVSALAGALLPARWASRVDVVAALAGRRGATKAPWRSSVLGVIAAGLGLILSIIGTRRLDALWILPGIALCELGILALTPGLLSVAALAGPRLPVSIRIAVRDASRNRTAAVPALAAVLAATTAAVSIAIFAASTAARDRAMYTPALPPGGVLVQLGTDLPFNAGSAASTAATEQTLASARRALEQYLPTSQSATISAAGCGPMARADTCTAVTVSRPADQACGAQPGSSLPPAADARRCGGVIYSRPTLLDSSVVIDPGDLFLLTGVHDPAAERALASGSVVVASALDQHGGQASLELDQVTPDGKMNPLRMVTLNATVLRSGFSSGVGLFLTPQTALRIGLRPTPLAVVAHLTRPATATEEQAVTAALADHRLSPQFERGYSDQQGWIILIALGVAVTVAAGATALATSLAMVDSRPDLATLWAVGAPLSTRRRLSMARAAVVGVIGALLGTLLGFVPPWMVIWAERGQAHKDFGGSATVVDPHPFAVPWWPNIIGTAVLVPLVAVLIAALMTRSRPEYRQSTPG